MDDSETLTAVEHHASRTPTPIWVHGFAWGGAFLVVIVVAWLSELLSGQHVWSNWAESRELRRSAYSEKVYFNELLRTRANTWSNLSYVIVGLYAIALGCVDWGLRTNATAGYLRRTPLLSVAFGITCCLLGFGSGLFHASLTRFGQHLDVAAMYTPLLVLISISLGRFLPTIPIGWHTRIATWPLLLIIVAITSWLLFLYKWQMSSLHVLTTLIVALTSLLAFDVVHRRGQCDQRWLIGSTVSLVLAVVCRQLDVAGNFSSPDAWWQGHAIWHVLTSMSLASVFLYFRS